MGLLLITLVVLCGVCVQAKVAYMEKSYEVGWKSGAFNHMVIHKTTGAIYIGAVNHLYKFDKDLVLVDVDVTGPKPDSPDCPPRIYDCDMKQVPTNSYNKALVIDYTGNKLLYCISLFQGICEKRDLDEIKEVDKPVIYLPMVANNATATTCMFIAPGCRDGQRNTTTDAIYVGVSRTNNGHSRHHVPAIASRKLEDFELVYKDISAKSQVTIDQYLSKPFPVYYRYGFSWKGFSYMLSVQKQNPSTTSFITKLIRVCQADLKFNSYAEVGLECHHDGILYNLLHAAYASKAGNNLAAALGIPPNEEVLYGVFSKGIPNSATPGQTSALCVYPLRNIMKMFTESIRACFEGTGNTGPAHLRSPVACVRTPTLAISEDYCGQYEVNSPIDGTNPIKAAAAAVFNYTASAVTTTIVTDHTVALVGTSNGHLIKIVLETQTKSTVYADMALFDGRKINADMYVSNEKEHLYLMTDRKIMKFPIGCEVYSECSTCVSSNDPHGCGWCSTQCTTQDRCNNSNVIWSPETCTPYISNFSPLAGPTAGGTMLTVTGNYFGYRKDSVKIRCGETDCVPTFINNTFITCTTIAVEKESSHRVTVTVNDTSKPYKVEGSATAPNQEFVYKIPSLSSVTPLLGPESGGTVITLEGKNLQIGLNQRADIGGSTVCDIKSVNTTEILCTTRPSHFVRKYFVQLTIDDAKLTSSKLFEYKVDSKVTSINQSDTIYSGGTQVIIGGNNLNIVQRPRIGVTIQKTGKSADEDCVPDDDGQRMVCIMPNLLPLITTLNQTQLIRVQIYFLMDGIQSLRDFDKSNNTLSRSTYYPNPTVFKFTEDGNVRVFDIAKDLLLEIKGNRLNQTVSEDDYTVLIDRKHCNLTALSSTSLSCRPDKPASDEQAKSVEVRIGKNLKFNVGLLLYMGQSPDNNAVPKANTVPDVNPDVIPIAIPIVVVIVILVIILSFVMKKKRVGPCRDKEDEMFRGGEGQDDTKDPEGRWLVEQNNQNGQSQGAAGAVGTLIDEKTRLQIEYHHLLIERQSLRLGKKLGAGQFGSVFEGYRTLADEHVEALVAVKTLHQNNPRQIDVQAFLKEALIMKDFNHANVLNLIGICLGMDDMPLVVLPYMKHGDLHTYLRNDSYNPTIKDLMMYSIDIAEGMAYLANLKFVHRDLACRNCM